MIVFSHGILHLDFNVLKNVLSNLDPTIKLTVEPAKFGNISKHLSSFFGITVLLT